MELHRSRSQPLLAVAFLVAGALMFLCLRPDGPVGAIVLFGMAGLSVLIGAALLVDGFLPFRFNIGADGLTLRRQGINRLVRWDEIDAIILEQPRPKRGKAGLPSARLLLVPAAGSGLDRPLTHRSPVDGRACLVLLELGEVREPPQQVAEALARLGGGRFTDARELLQKRFRMPDFTVTLRGYEMARVDELVRRGHDALGSDRLLDRHSARAAIESASLPVVMRGYDREQVDTLLRELSAALAAWGAEEHTEPR